jgi:actin-related protein 3
LLLCIPPLTLSSYTKLGYAGQYNPSYIIPTTYAGPEEKAGFGQRNLDDLSFFIGEEALAHAKTHTVHYPIRHGLIEDWDQMERYWEQCIFRYLRADPETHNFVLTEPPLNSPENRQQTAEIMFETFNVSGLYIAVQAVLALIASWNAKNSKTRDMTGTVVDIGDGVTHVIPVVDNYVIASAIKHIPIAGSNVTEFVQTLLRQREVSKIPAGLSRDIARRIKERHSYICRDLRAEFLAWDQNPAKHVVQYHGQHPMTGKPFSIDIGPERFLGPEVFFNPSLISSDYTTPLHVLVDEAIQACPIDTRRALYNNVVLSGGSTMFKAFGKRLQRDLGTLCQERVDRSFQKHLERVGTDLSDESARPKPVDVNVVSHASQRYAVWLGGSMTATLPQFDKMVITRAQYEEYGSVVARSSRTIDA